MKILLSQALSTIAPVLNLTTTDTRATDYINRAVERLNDLGNWKGTVQRYRICMNDGCITWPREIATIISYAIDDVPGDVRNEWFEFLPGGFGVQNSDDLNGSQLLDRGLAPTFDDVRGDDKKLQVYADVAEDASSYVILRFHDENNNYVRSQSGGEWIDGEKLLPLTAGAYTTTTNFCCAGGLLEVVKTTTNGVIRLYEYDTVNLTRKPLGYYQPSETIPSYRRSMVPGLAAVAGEDCDEKTITVMAKKAFVPAVANNDVLLIESMEAIRLGCQAIQKEEKDLLGDAANYWQMAVGILQKQLETHQGHGVTVPVKFMNGDLFGAGNIPLLR